MKNALIEFVKKYAPVSEEQAGVLADYALATWQPLPKEVKYLHIVGERGTGKTILGKVMAAICKNPLVAHGYCSYAVVLTALDASYPATLIIEEYAIDSANLSVLLDVAWSEMLGKVSGRDVFGHKVILGRFPFFVPDIEYRCIRVYLERKQDFIPLIRDKEQFERDAIAFEVMLNAEFGGVA